ncbi:MAG: hypothetical protein OXH09_20435 [Gammaproteobacteria bacterium]|nr:hypothetical protein [Gammaproteobacteria bacterium]
MNRFCHHLVATTAVFLGCVALGDHHGPDPTVHENRIDTTPIVERNPFHDNAKMVPASFAETVRLRMRSIARHDGFDRLGFDPGDADVLREVARIDTGAVRTAARAEAAQLLVEMCSLPGDAVLKRGLLFAEFDRKVTASVPAAIAEKLAELTPKGAATLAGLIGKDRARRLAHGVEAAALAFEDREYMAEFTAALCEKEGL